jgi:hypothetical protein
VKGVTLTGVDLSVLPDLMSQFNNFAYVLQSEDQSAVASARTYAQAFTSIFGKEVPPSYIDLGNFVQLTAKQAGSSALDQAASAVMDELDRLIVAEKHGLRTGLSRCAIWPPNHLPLSLHGLRSIPVPLFVKTHCMISLFITAIVR